MTRYRVSMTRNGRRIATSTTWDSVSRAQAYADDTNRHRPGSRALVVIDSPENRRLVP
jgi:hypothetical protein